VDERCNLSALRNARSVSGSMRRLGTGMIPRSGRLAIPKVPPPSFIVLEDSNDYAGLQPRHQIQPAGFR
jgi:hypothetical protein